MNVESAYRSGVQNLVASGQEINEARAIMRRILEALTDVRDVHLLQPDRILDGIEEAVYFTDLFELCEGRPLPYILNEIEFFGLEFKCDKRALIPRPDTETLVEAALARLKKHPSPLVADLGTGTGCIAISIAHELSQAVVYATDASSDALALAETNAKKLDVKSRVELVAGEIDNWAQPLLRAGFGGKIDAVLSNPPYIAQAEIETLQPQIRLHEPHSALDGGADGLDCYRQIAAQCGELLAPDGFLMCELGAGQFAAVRLIFEQCGWFVESPILDIARIERVLCAKLVKP